MPIITALILSIVASCFISLTSAWSHPAPELCVSRWVTATGWNCDHHCDHLESCPQPTTPNPFDEGNPPPDLSDLETPYACIDPPDGVCHDYCDTCTFTEPDEDDTSTTSTDNDRNPGGNDGGGGQGGGGGPGGGGGGGGQGGGGGDNRDN